MTLGGFVLGLILMAAGFAAVVRTDWFLENLGDVSQVFGMENGQWFSWKLVGMILLLVGFMIAFGLFQLFFYVVFGSLFGLYR